MVESRSGLCRPNAIGAPPGGICFLLPFVVYSRQTSLSRQWRNQFVFFFASLPNYQSMVWSTGGSSEPTESSLSCWTDEGRQIATELLFDSRHPERALWETLSRVLPKRRFFSSRLTRILEGEAPPTSVTVDRFWWQIYVQGMDGQSSFTAF